jgi:hypothetical protein
MNETQLSFYIREILKEKKLKEGTCGYSEDGDIDPKNTDKLTPAGPSIQEALSPEVLKRAELIKNTIVGKNRDKIVKKYGPEAEKVIHGRAIKQAQQQIEKEQGTEEIEEVSSEKQRKYMCAVSQPGAKRPKGLTQAKAKEMCSDTALSKKKLQEDIIDKTDFVLPRGKKMILQAEDEDYNRGLIVELTNEGGYKMYYWYGDDAEIYPVEVEVDGESIKPDAREVYMKFHPELKENKNMKNTRLTELIKSALMKETSTDKYDDNPALKGKQSELPDGLQKAIIKKKGGKVDEYASLARYDKDGNKTVTTIDDIDILPRHKRLQHEMAFNDFITTLKALGYDIPEGILPMEENIDEDKVKGSNIKKVGDDWRVLSGKTGKMWKQKYGSKKDAEDALKGYFASQNESLAETILKELRGNVNEMAGEDLELKSLAKKMIPTLKKLGFEVEYSTDTSMKTLKNAGDKFVALRVQDGMLGVHIPFKSGLDAAKEIQKEIQKSLGNEFEYKLTKSKRGPGLEFYTILIRNK